MKNGNRGMRDKDFGNAGPEKKTVGSGVHQLVYDMPIYRRSFLGSSGWAYNIARAYCKLPIKRPWAIFHREALMEGVCIHINALYLCNKGGVCAYIIRGAYIRVVYGTCIHSSDMQCDE